MGVPIRLHGTPGRAAAAPPLLGQHTEQVLRSLVGLTRAEIAGLREKGVL